MANEESNAPLEQEELDLENLDGGETPEAPSEPPAPSAPAVDYAALEQRAAQIRPGTTLQNIVDQFAEQRSTLDRTTTRLDQFEREYGFGKPLLDEIKKNPNFAKAMRTAAEDFFSGGDDDDSPPNIPANVSNVLDPISRELSDIKMELASQKMNQQMDDLSKKYPGLLTNEVKAQVWQTVSETGNSDLEMIFAKTILPTLVANSAKASSDAQRMQRNAQAYTGVDGTATVPETKPDGNYTDDDIEAGIAEVMRGGKI